MRKNAPIQFILSSVMLSGLLACGGSNHKSPEAPSTPAYLNSTLAPDVRANDLLSRMTLFEKAGQMITAEKASIVTAEEVRVWGLGSVFSGGGSAPAKNEPNEWAAMVDGFQRKALATPHAIPMLYGIDAIHGHNTAWGAVIFPHNIGLGAAGDADLTQRIGQATAEEMKATGIRWTFAPCVAVPQNERWGRTYEGFGEIPSLSSTLGAAYIRGFQGSSLGASSVLATAKHYLADGGTLNGIDQGDAQIDEATLRSVHLPPYQAAVDAGVQCVMPSYSSWNGQKVHGSHQLLTELLRGEMKFKGFVVSDYNALNQLPGSFDDKLKAGINAGIDMLMIGSGYEAYVDGLERLAISGDIPQSRIDEAVKRILTVKFQMGLFEHPYSDPSMRNNFATDAHRQLAREAVAKSAVLLKNEAGLLPVKSSVQRILVVGYKADLAAIQMGGWTLSWQGWATTMWGIFANWKGDWPTGTTLRKAIQNAATAKNIQVDYSVDGKLPVGAAKPDLVILAIGEKPYAEYAGDSKTLALLAEDLTLLTETKNIGAPIVTVLYSGRPMIINDVLASSNAFLAAWLPGSEVEGLSDLIFGTVKPTGKLSHTWPSSFSQLPIKQGDGQTPLFELGYGLTYP